MLGPSHSDVPESREGRLPGMRPSASERETRSELELARTVDGRCDLSEGGRLIGLCLHRRDAWGIGHTKLGTVGDVV